ncbi:MAG: protein kinase, partial [Acidobacteria bacterium]|nr:protein kinase [Acidobacteriota bacterium]
MPLTPGTTLGRYEISTPLGAGGMGEVYLAHDTALRRRPVAVKLLPADFSRDEGRLRRFEQEAYAVAKLNHPAVAHIYEIGESDGLHFIAMEYVEGETLGEMIHGERAPLAKLLKYLAQVAEGLAKAHAAGIVHRDLKPDNVMIARDGYAKILDFGLAKLVEPQKTSAADGDAGEAATALIRQLSSPGVVMGTVGYMSPEQAQGRVSEIDQRSDVFSFGCILYEAATGRRPFEGKDALDSLHKIVHAPVPQIKETNPGAPGELQRIVRRCLQKDPERRYQSIKDVAIELEELLQELRGETEPTRPEVSTTSGGMLSGGIESGGATTSGAQSASQTQTSAAPEAPRSASSAEYLAGQIRRHKTGAVVALAAVVLGVAAAAFGLYKLAERDRSASTARFQPGKVDRLTGTGNVRNVAISPDGKFVAYAADEGGRQSLWVRDVATTSSVQAVAPAEVEYTGLNFSPDSNYVYYSRAEKGATTGVLYQVPKLGGTPKKLLAGVDSSVTFSPDGKRLAFLRALGAKESALVVADADGTNERKLASASAPALFSVYDSAPGWSPDGKVIACGMTHAEANGLYSTVVGVNVADGTIRPLSSQRWDDIFGKLAWEADGGGLLMSAREKRGLFNAAQIWRLSYPGGEAQQITQGLSRYYNVSLTSDSRSLVAITQDMFASVWTAPVGRAGAATQLTSTPGARDGYCGVAWTNGGKILYVARKIARADIWVMNADGGSQQQLTDSEDVERYPSLTRDGRYMVFDMLHGGTSNIWRADADGGNLKQLTNGVFDHTPHCSPDGKWVAYLAASQLWKVPIDGGQPVQLTDQPSECPAFSPDGKLVACYYQSETSAPWRLALVPAEGGQPSKLFDVATTRNTSGSGAPRIWIVLRWTPDGRSILYVADSGGASNIWSQPVEGGKPVQLTDFKSDLIWTFDLSPDGKQLVMSRGRYVED